MSELTELLSLIGLNDLLDDLYPTDEKEAEGSNYLLEGKRILSLARSKRKRSLFKEGSLTVRLCDIKYPLLESNAFKINQQIEHTIKNLIKKELKEIETLECLLEKGIPFLLSFCTEPVGYKIGLTKNQSNSTLAKEVSNSQLMIALTIEEEIFYIPCNPHRRFQNTDYYYKRFPENTIHMLHADVAFFALWGISWLNQLKHDSFSDPSISDTLKYLLRNISGCLLKHSWDATSLPEWLSEYLIDNSYTLNHETNCYILSNEENNTKDTKNNGFLQSGIHGKAPDNTPVKLSDFTIDILNLVSFVYGDTLLSAKDLLHKSDSNIFFSLPFYYEKYIISTLQYFISNIQDIKEEEKHRKKLDGMVARAYMTKRNIPQIILKEMQNSELNRYFGFIEFDEEVDLKSVGLVTQEFQKLNHRIFHDFKSPNVALRFRKLGRHHASGLYYPSINTMVVDFRHPDSFVHEYFHMLDDTLGNLSLQCTFDKVVTCYQRLVRKAVEEEKKKGGVLLSSKGKYNINYYLRKCEIFARCGEIYLFRNQHIVSSLLKPEETKYFAYPDDDMLNQFIDEYYTSLLDHLKDIKIDKRKETYETDLHIADQ